MYTSLKFCRFCAKSSNEFDLTSSLTHFEDVKNRLILLGINYVNFNEEGLPKAICASCNLNLKNCYHVFERIKDSQTVLRQLFLQNEGTIEKEISTYEKLEDFPFDFDCPRLKNVDESTRETVKTLALLPFYDARWHQRDARTRQLAQNAGLQQQPLNLEIAVQQALKPMVKEQQDQKPAAKDQQPLKRAAKEKQPLKPLAKEQQPLESIAKQLQPLKPKTKKQQALEANKTTQMAVDRPLSPKTKTKRIKDSILKDWIEVENKGEDELDKKDQNAGNPGRQKRKHVMNLRYSAKDYLYYIPGDRRRSMK